MNIKQELEQLDERCVELVMRHPGAKGDIMEIRVCIKIAMSEFVNPQEDSVQFLRDCISDTRAILDNLWEFYETGPDTIRTPNLPVENLGE